MCKSIVGLHRHKILHWTLIFNAPHARNFQNEKFCEPFFAVIFCIFRRFTCGKLVTNSHIRDKFIFCISGGWSQRNDRLIIELCDCVVGFCLAYGTIMFHIEITNKVSVSVNESVRACVTCYGTRYKHVTIIGRSWDVHKFNTDMHCFSVGRVRWRDFQGCTKQICVLHIRVSISAHSTILCILYMM